ncbi:MAG: GHMP kinase [Candidatus Eisenbacteria bacterium]|uniref:GHMP kinase n=1 Tax=Eiseniibacteriota bacterium TaxID=2212470 RepID=A0A948RV26_UNCEI|nr:GHMP kinase [Candidatus Eisenbacteria bacterium]MBU1948816.1 GHMP kinase [Candidatus Eisenbacteria bacterium]MBU2689987.1 GHMP kinase [Candidatus Eisenbacteria bacterium]
MIYRAKAPLRISFCGGGTDVSPYPEERGGIVLSTTINLYAFASLRALEEPIFRLRSLDYELSLDIKPGEPLLMNGQLDLLKGALGFFREECRRLGLRSGDVGGLPAGIEILSHTDAPPGSGLGSSSTMVTTLVGVFQDWLGKPLAPYDIAELTYHIERERVKISGGRQDQYAAVFGGFNLIEFHNGYTIVNPLRIRRATMNELEGRLLLVYTGKTRLSAHIVDRQTHSYREKKQDVVEALDEMKALAVAMKNALLQDDLDEFGRCLHEAWLHKKHLDEGITNPQIDALYQKARDMGCLGGKILGAGGGGYLLLYCPYDLKHRIGDALKEIGGMPTGFAFEDQGLQTWTVNS